MLVNVTFFFSNLKPSREPSGGWEALLQATDACSGLYAHLNCVLTSEPAFCYAELGFDQVVGDTGHKVHDDTHRQHEEG